MGSPKALFWPLYCFIYICFLSIYFESLACTITAMQTILNFIAWMSLNCFYLNESKTEIIEFGSSEVPNISHVNSGVYLLQLNQV